MKRFTGRTVAKIYSVTMALTALAAFVVYSQQKANTNAISSSKSAAVLSSSKSRVLVEPVSSNTNAPAPLILSGTKSFSGVTSLMTGVLSLVAGSNGALTVTGEVSTGTVTEASASSNAPPPVHLYGSKSGAVFEPAPKYIPSPKSAAVFEAPVPKYTTNNAPQHQQRQMEPIRK